MSMQETAYVRTEMLPEREPPSLNTGPIGWIRANLFPNWFSSLLTLASLFIIYKLLAAFIPWAFGGVWNASSLKECREILQGVDAACWAVIHERFWQLMYGFYPDNLYWRPNLALVMLIVALVPVLFEGAPRKLLAVTIATPFIGPWLLWGGTIWTPVAAALGFVVGYIVYKLIAGALSDLAGLVLGPLAAVLWWILLAGRFSDLMAGILPLGLQPVESRKFGGFMLAVTLGITGIAASFPLGIILALGRQSHLVIVKTLSVGFIEFIRGVPLITLLFVAQVMLAYFLPRGTQFDIILRVMIMITLFSAAYMAEVIRGGLAALPKGQYEAADALGLNYWQAQRLIIMPQALKIAIPGIVSTFIGLFKDTTLVSIIGLADPLGWVKLIQADAAWNGIVWELYGFVAFVFFIVCFSMSRYSMYLERKLETGHK